MMPKKYATIYVDEDVLREAREIGLNISRICENALKDAIEKLKFGNINENIDCRKGPVAQTGRVSAWHAGGRGFKSRPVHHFHFL